MLSKNNLQERLRKMEPKKNHYSIRKFTVGVASVLIGMTFMEMSNGQTVKADTVTSQVRDQETQVSQEKNSAASELSKNANISTQQEANKQDAASSQKVNEQNAKNKTEETEKTSPLNGSVNSTNEVSPQSSNNTSKPVTVDSNKVGHFAVALNSKKDNKINSTISNKVEENLSENKVIKPSTNIQKSESTTSKIDSSKTTTGLKASLQSPEITDKKLQDLKTTLVAKSSEEANITNATNYPDTNGMVPEDQYIFNQFHLTSGQLTPDKKNWQSLPLVITLATDKNNPGTDLHYYITDDDYTNKYAIGNLPVNQSYRYTSNPYSNAGLTIYNFGKDGISVDSFNQQYGLAHIFGYGKGVEKILENPYEYNNVSNSWGDVVPQTIKQTISYINKNTGEEMPGMPQIEQTGLTGQTYNASQVNKKVIDGYYLINSRVAQGTLSQFKAGETFTKKWVDSAGNTIDENWYQLDNEGLMQLTVNITSPNGTTTKIVNKNVVKPDGSVDSGAYNFANPYVPSTADIKLLYAPVGRIIPVDKDGNEIPNAPQPRYTNDPDDASKVKSNEPVPTVPGYTPSVPTVTPTDPGKDTPVIYNPVIEKGSVIVTVHDNTDNVDLPQYGYNSGEENVGSKVDFNKSQTITDLEKAGYKVINPDVVIPTEITKGSNTVTIYVEHSVIPVTPDKPGNGVTSDDLQDDVTRTVTYEGAGSQNPSQVSDTLHFTAQGYYDSVTKKWTDASGKELTDQSNPFTWTSQDGTKFASVHTPFINGYHIQSVSDHGTSTGDVEAITGVKHGDSDINIKVTYQENGKIIPVDPSGKQIPNVPTPQYPTDPANPTKVTDQGIPSVPGWHVDTTQTTPGLDITTGKVTPVDPSKDTPVIYVKDEAVVQHAQVIFRDVNDPSHIVQIGTSGDLTGQAGDTIVFSNKQSMIDDFTKKGYVLKSDGFQNVIFDNNKDNVQIFNIDFVHGTTPVDPTHPGKPGEPINPDDPKGPKYPEGSDVVTKDITRTIHYEGAGDKNPSDVTQPVHFTAKGVLDKVTGEWVTPLTWNKNSEDVTGVATKVIDGYHVTGVSRDSKDNINVDSAAIKNSDKSYTVTVTYAPNGKIIPVDPSGKPIPNADTPQYPTDPTDPSKVTPNEPVPNVPGYTPETPTVTPTDPGKDTPVIYNPVKEQVAVVNYIDSDNNNSVITSSGNLSGKSGSQIDYSTKSTLTDLINKGYVLVNNGFDPDGIAPNFDSDDNTTQVFQVILKHGQQPVNPETPGKPGEPINPDDPEGPKYPEGSDVVTKNVTRTIQYVGADDQTPKSVEQTAKFIATGVLDKVTGQWITPLTWSDNQTLDNVVSPTIKGYHVTSVSADSTDNINVNSKTVSHTDNNSTVVVTYTKDAAPVIDKGTITVTVHDVTTDADLPEYGKQSGEEDVGTKFDFDKTTTITELTNKGYKVINPDVVIPTEITKGSQTVTIYVEHNTTPINPDKPGKPGEPINPNDPEGPKYPEGTDKNSLIKTGTQTVHYEGAGDLTPADNITNVEFTHSMVIDNVTGKIITDNGWTPSSQNHKSIVTPTIEGYTADVKVAGGETVTIDPKTGEGNIDRTYTVTYTKNPTPVIDKGTITVTVHDVTTDADLPQYGKQSGEKDVGTKFDFDKTTTITELTNKGYKVINPDVVIPTEITKGSQTVTIYVEHNTTPINPDKPGKPGEPINPNDPEGPKYPEGTDKNSLIKTGTQTVHYEGAGDLTPADNTTTVEFTHSMVIDNVTGKIITDNGWTPSSQNHKSIVTPTIEGYTADVKVAGGETVTIDPKTGEGNIDRTYTVTYTKNPTPVIDKGTITVTVHDVTTDADLPQYGKQSGEKDVGTKFDFDKTTTITELTNKGYKVINPDVVIPTEITKGSNTVTIYVEHTTTTVTPDKPGKPGEPVDPNNPEGPKYPDGTDENAVKRTGTQTVHYTGAGSQTPSDKKQSFDFTRTIIFDNVTGKIINTTPWNVTSHTFGYENTPVVDGYHADQRIAGGTTVTPDDLNKTVTVNYNQNGKIIPVDPEGNPIPNVPTPTYPTDPSDPTKVTPNEPVPNVPGYTPETPTVTPTDPGKDTPVIYTPIVTDKGQVTVVVHDKTDNIDLPKYGYNSGEQEVGYKVDFNKNQTITDLTKAGYNVLNPDVVIPAEITKGSYTVTINVEHTTTTVTPNKPGKPGEPVDPNNPTGPKYPDGTNENAIKRTGTQTIHYTGAGKDTPSDKKQSFDFTRTITFDNVTGKIINTTPWNETSHTFGYEDTPVIDGYHADKRTAGDTTVTPDDLNKTVTVTYIKNGKIIPVGPDGKTPIPNVPTPTYPTDPKNPTEVTPNEPVPNVPGYTPEVPTVTPTDPGKDTPVIYTPVENPTPEEPLPTTIEGTQTIKFETEDGTQLESPNVQKAQFTGSHTFGKVNVPVIPGYVATQTTAGGLTVTESKPNVGQTVIYKKIGKIIPVDSNGNPIPNANQPQYTNDSTNPTKVMPNESVPDVPGYTPESSTVTPVDPTTDTPVVYKKDEIPRKPSTSHKSDKETPSRPEAETSESYESALTTANNTNAKGKNAKSNIGRAKAAAHQNTLPQTGEKDTEIAGLAGLALMAVAGMISLLGGKDRKRKKN
ncbi:mucin-binding protein [Lactobacillus paragasseri]|uniref:mucin-binding protein n=1 Tax=Lactobacillus paragasseri TaxID=2107999 RepID=UPI0021AE0C51|nr:YSIRK-type signal peptide-containing protein [Lactobacillus paragasseri]